MTNRNPGGRWVLRLEIEADAKTQEAAVRWAEDLLRDPMRGPLVWEVLDLENEEEGWTEIDAEEISR